MQLKAKQMCMVSNMHIIIIISWMCGGQDMKIHLFLK